MSNSRGLAENTKTLIELREQMEAEPWIRLRNKLITELVNKRRELGVTQTDVAGAMNVPSSSITRFESMSIARHGVRITPPNPTIKFIASYAATLGLDIDFSLVPSK